MKKAAIQAADQIRRLNMVLAFLLSAMLALSFIKPYPAGTEVTVHHFAATLHLGRFGNEADITSGGLQN